MHKELKKQYTKQLLITTKCCFCISLGGSIGYIACFLLLRSLGLIGTSFVPPLIKIEIEESFRYPDGHNFITTYFDDSRLNTIYTFNILCSFFLLCYGVSVYYTWSLTQSDLVKINKIDRRLYEKLPKAHYGFIVYLILQSGILLLIDLLDLPKGIIIFKPTYISLGAAFLFEFFLIYIVKWYVKVSLI